MGSEREASDHTGGSATDGYPVWEPEVVERGAPGSGGSRQDGPSGPEIRLESTK